MKIIIFIVVLFFGALVWAVSRTGDQVLTGSDQAAVLAYTEPIADNLFAGYATNDYAVFSRDFDADMQETIPADFFIDWKQDLDDKLGSYISRQVEQVTQSDEYHIVVYQVKFEKDQQVEVGIVFHTVEPHAINHLSIDSDEL